MKRQNRIGEGVRRETRVRSRYGESRGRRTEACREKSNWKGTFLRQAGDPQ